MVATIGRAVIDGMTGDDILEDHGAEAILIGGSGNDKLISRNGRDALWGGNLFALTTCSDTDNGADDELDFDCSFYSKEDCG